MWTLFVNNTATVEFKKPGVFQLATLLARGKFVATQGYGPDLRGRLYRAFHVREDTHYNSTLLDQYIAQYVRQIEKAPMEGTKLEVSSTTWAIWQRYLHMIPVQTNTYRILL